MTRAAVNAAAAADALLAWLETQTRVGASTAPMKSEGCPEKATSDGSPGLPDVCTLDVPALTPPAGQDPAKRTEAEPQAMPMRLAHTDWLHSARCLPACRRGRGNHSLADRPRPHRGRCLSSAGGAPSATHTERSWSTGAGRAVARSRWPSPRTRCRPGGSEPGVPVRSACSGPSA